MKGQSKIVVQVILHIDTDLNNSKKWKNSGVKLQSSELKSCAEKKTAMIVLAKWSFL